MNEDQNHDENGMPSKAGLIATLLIIFSILLILVTIWVWVSYGSDSSLFLPSVIVTGLVNSFTSFRLAKFHRERND